MSGTRSLKARCFKAVPRCSRMPSKKTPDPHLEEVRWSMGTKYSVGHGETPSIERVRYPQTASGRSARWVVFEPSRLITWDNHKLPKR